MKLTLFLSLFGVILCGSVLQAADYKNLPMGSTLFVNVSDVKDVHFQNVVSTENGGALRVEAGSSIVEESSFTETYSMQEGGTAILGATADNSFYSGSLEVQAGALLVESDVIAHDVSVSDSAEIVISGGNLSVGGSGVPAISVSGKNNDARLSGVLLQKNGLHAAPGGENAWVRDAVIVVEPGAGLSAVEDVHLMGSTLELRAGATLSNLTVDESGSISVTGGIATMSGHNFLTTDSVESTQLSGVTLADGCSLTLTFSKTLLEELELEEGDTTITLRGVGMEQNADITLQGGVLPGLDYLTTVESYTTTAAGIQLTMGVASAQPRDFSLNGNQSRAYAAICSIMDAQGNAILAMGTPLSHVLEVVSATRDESELKRILNQITGAEYAVLMSNQMDGNLTHLRLLRHLAGTGNMLTNGKRGTDWYAHAFNDTVDVDTDATGRGYRREEWGAILGTEKNITRRFYLGADLSAGRAHITPGGTGVEFEQDSVNLDCYADYRAGAWRSLTALGLGIHRFDLSRSGLPGASSGNLAETDGLSLNFMQEISYQIKIAESAWLHPFLAIDSSWNRIDSFSESGALSLSVQEQDAWSTEITLGLRLSARFSLLPSAPDAIWTLQSGAVASVGDTTADTSVSFSEIPGYHYLQRSADRERWGWNIGATLEFPLTDRTALFGSAEGILRSDASQFETQIGLRYSF